MSRGMTEVQNYLKNRRRSLNIFFKDPHYKI